MQPLVFGKMAVPCFRHT